MNQKSQRRKNIITIVVLIVLFLGVGYWTFLQVYPSLYGKFFAPVFEGEQVQEHLLNVGVDRNQNMSIEEVLAEERTVIMWDGGLFFFRLGPGQNFTREIEIANPYRNALAIEYGLTDIEYGLAGDIAPFTTYEGPDVLEPGTKDIISITVTIPEDKESIKSGIYKGNFTITFTPK